MVVPLPKAFFHHDKMRIHVVPAFFLKFFFSKFGKWANVGFPSDEDRKGKRCLSEYKLDTPMSSLAKDELSVSMVTRSSLSYGYPLTSLWSYFLLYSRPYRHTHTHMRAQTHTSKRTQIFFPPSMSLLLFLPHLLSSPTLLHSPSLFLLLKMIPCALSTRIAFYVSLAPLFLSFFDSHAAHYINRAQAPAAHPQIWCFYWSSSKLTLVARMQSCCPLFFFFFFFHFSVSSLNAKVAGTRRRRCSEKCLS